MHYAINIDDETLVYIKRGETYAINHASALAIANPQSYIQVFFRQDADSGEWISIAEFFAMNNEVT